MSAAAEPQSPGSAPGIRERGFGGSWRCSGAGRSGGSSDTAVRTDRSRGTRGARPWPSLTANTRSGLLKVTRVGAAPNAIEGDVWLPIGPRPIVDGTYSYAGRITALATVPGAPTWSTRAPRRGRLEDDRRRVRLDPAHGRPGLARHRRDRGRSLKHQRRLRRNRRSESVLRQLLRHRPSEDDRWRNDLDESRASTFQNTSIAKIVVHPTIPTTLWVANGSGTRRVQLLRSFRYLGRLEVHRRRNELDAGSRQRLRREATRPFTISCGRRRIPNILYAAVDAIGIWKTINGRNVVGQIGGRPAHRPTSGGWTSASIPCSLACCTLIAERIQHRLSARDVTSPPTAGATWTDASDPQRVLPLLGFSGPLHLPGGGFGGQCWYDLVLEVQAGTFGLGRRDRDLQDDQRRDELDRRPVTQSVHVDQHAMAFGSDGRVWIGNDGGVWASSNSGASWVNKNGNLQITQFYPGAALDPSNYERALAGAQDNGTPRMDGSIGVEPRRPSATARRASSTRPVPTRPGTPRGQYLSITKTVNGGLYYASAVNGLTDANTGAAPFIGQFQGVSRELERADRGERQRLENGRRCAGSGAPNSPTPDPAGRLAS